MAEHLNRRGILRSGAAAGLALATAGSWAQASAWPSKPVTLVVPFPAGGGTDAFARPLVGAVRQGDRQDADHRQPRRRRWHAWAQASPPRARPTATRCSWAPCTTPSRPRCTPGSTTTSKRTSFRWRCWPTCRRWWWSTPSACRSTNFQEFLAHVKRNPAKLNYGSAGAGTSHHLAGELFKQQSGTFITHIPYRGAGPALQDLIAGNVDMMFDGLGSSATHIKSGRIKALMVSGAKRNPAFPDVPCAAEVGLPDYTVTTWYGLWAPKGTPADVQARIVEEIQAPGRGRRAQGRLGQQRRRVWRHDAAAVCRHGQRRGQALGPGGPDFGRQTRIIPF